MTQRPTFERFADLREDSVSPYVPFDHRADLCDLLAEADSLRADLAAERASLEVERMRLAACATAALGYFDGCHPDYDSASLQDVLRIRSDLAIGRAETARLKAELAEAEQRGREAERQDVLEWMRDDNNYERIVGRSCGAIERGDHVRSPGTPAPGAAKGGCDETKGQTGEGDHHSPKGA